MVKIIQAYNRPNPLADAITRAAEVKYGDTLTPALKREQLSGMQRENQGATDFAGTFVDPRLNALARSGATPAQIADAMLLGTGEKITAGQLDPFSQAVAGAQIGAGKAIGSTGVGVLQGQNFTAGENVKDRSADYSRALAVQGLSNQGAMDRLRATPLTEAQIKGGLLSGNFDNPDLTLDQRALLGLVPSETQAKGDAFTQTWPTLSPMEQKAAVDALLSLDQTKALSVPSDLSRDESLAFIGAEPKAAPGYKQFFNPATQQTQAVQDGVAPPEGFFPAGTVGVQADSAADIGLTNSNQTNLNDQALSLATFQNSLARARELAASPDAANAFGIVGALSRTAQGVGEQLRGIDQAFGTNFTNSVRSDVDRRIGHGDPVAEAIGADVFNPALAAVPRMAKLLAYEAASAVAAQTGRGLSDKDYAAFLNIIGDPEGLLASPRSFMAALDQLETAVGDRVRVNTAARHGGIDAAVGAASGVDPELDAILNQYAPVQ